MAGASTAGRPRDRDVDRRITQAALDVFADAGWAGFTIEAVARRGRVGKASIYLRWSSKTDLLSDAVTLYFGGTADVNAGSLREDLIALATQALRGYAGPNGRAFLRLALEGDSIPAVADRYRDLQYSQILAARALVRRGIARSELPPGTNPDLLIDTVVGGALMHALTTPPGRRDDLANKADSVARDLVGMLLHALPSTVTVSDHLRTD